MLNFAAIGNKILLFFLFLLGSLYSNCQTIKVDWEKVYPGLDGDEVWDCIVAPDGGFIITGSTDNQLPGPIENTPRIFLMKVRSDGEQEWFKDYDIHGSGRDVINTSDGGFLIVGGYNAERIEVREILVKTDSRGEIEWVKKTEKSDYVRFAAYEVIEHPDGGYLSIGVTRAWETYIHKVNEQGEEEWLKILPIETSVYYDILLNPNGGFILGGGSRDQVDFHDTEILLVSIDLEGNHLWTTHLGDQPNIGDGHHLTKMEFYNNDLIVLATIDERHNAYLARLDENGNLKWEKTLYREYFDANFIIDSDDNIFLADCIYSSHFFQKFDIEDGTRLTSDSISVTAPNKFLIMRQLRKTKDGGFVFAGHNNEGDVYLMKSKGNTLNSSFEKSPTSLIVFPNPTSNAFQIYLPESKAVSVQLFNASGRLVLVQANVRSGEELSIAHLPKGMYFYQFRSEKREVIHAGKLVVIR